MNGWTFKEWLTFSTLIRSGMVIMQRYPFTAAVRAMPIPADSQTKRLSFLLRSSLFGQQLALYNFLGIKPAYLCFQSWVQWLCLPVWGFQLFQRPPPCAGRFCPSRCLQRWRTHTWPLNSVTYKTTVCHSVYLELNLVRTSSGYLVQ